MRRWLWVPVLAAAAGCNSLSTIGQATYERMMLPLMSDVQKAQYYQRPTWAERKACLYEITLIQKFESFPETIRRAILREHVVPGMSPEQVIMSWGVPSERLIITPEDDPEVLKQQGRKEQWLYSRVLTADLQVRYLRAVAFTNDVVLHVRDDRRGR